MGPQRGDIMRAVWWSVGAVVMVCVGQAVVTAADPCPWERSGLKAWNNPSSWPKGRVPKTGDKVTIPKGTSILFNESVDLTSLEIQKDAELIWADLPNLQLKTEYILVDGAFHMGSPSCRLKQNASVILKGRPNSDVFLTVGDDEVRKAILVREGGTFEVHGPKKTSWTRLAQSIPILSDMPCAYRYNHSDYVTNPFAADRSAGMHVIVWNRDASVFDYGVYRDFTTLKDFITNVPDGKVIGMTAFKEIDLHDSKKSKSENLHLYDVIVNVLGGKVYATAKPTDDDTYSLLTVKGDRSSTLEYYKENGKKDVDLYEDFLQLTVKETDLVFQVATSAQTDRDYFRVLQARFAMPILELADDVQGWKPGDKIVVASTDYDWKQAEVREIVQCDECSSSQIRVNTYFRYRHFGNITYNVDERAEVGMLTRNILFEGETEKECRDTTQAEKKKQLCDRFKMDTYGGHIRIEKGFASVHVQGAELYHMGQQMNLACYPLHFHMCDSAEGSWVRDNSIHHTFSRCVTIHGTDDLEVSGNVCYRHIGHGYFLEDSAEQNNKILNNLGLGTMYGTLLMSDSSKDWCKDDYDGDMTEHCAEVSTFWLTHPNNDVSGNSAGGGDCHGFMFVFADVPLGPSFKRQQVLNKVPPFHAKSHPIKRFYNNAAHSYYRIGVWFDSYISSGGNGPRDYDVPENGIIQSEPEYDPKDPPGDYNGTRVWTKMERVTAYKNRQGNMWIKGGNINVTFSSLADAADQSFSGGCTGFWTGTSLEYSVVIGRTDNLGQPTYYREPNTDLAMWFNGSIGRSPWSTKTGVGLYQGPMYVKHSYFDRFYTEYWNDAWKSKLGKRPVSYAGAVSWKRDSTYPVYTSQYITNLTFGFCDNVNNGHHVFFGDQNIFKTYDWTDKCGPKNAFTYDKDGSVTGTRGAGIVRIRPFTSGPECLTRRDWGMNICPYKYIKLEFKGDDGSLSKTLHDQYPLVARRDDEPDDVFIQRATQRMEYLTRTYKSYTVGMNITLRGAQFPKEFRVFGYGVEKDDVIRVGLCVPKTMRKFEVMSEYPVPIKRNHTVAKSLKEVDEDETDNVIFHDTKNGMLFFKLWSRHYRTNDSQLCPAGYCYRLKITFLDGDRKARDCSEVKVPPFKDPRTRTPKRITKTKSCKIGSPVGLGAVRWNEVSKIVHEDFSLPCLDTPKPPAPSKKPAHVDCLVEDTQKTNFVMAQDMQRTMTVDWCITRCYQRGFEYAGLTARSVCKCSHKIDYTVEARDVKKNTCESNCPGTPDDDKKTCGSNGRLDVWTTGL